MTLCHFLSVGCYWTKFRIFLPYKFGLIIQHTLSHCASMEAFALSMQLIVFHGEMGGIVVVIFSWAFKFRFILILIFCTIYDWFFFVFFIHLLLFVRNLYFPFAMADFVVFDMHTHLTKCIWIVQTYAKRPCSWYSLFCCILKALS